LEVNAPEPKLFKNPFEVSDKDYDEIRAELDKKKADQKSINDKNAVASGNVTKPIAAA
jgi:hypothetical protein